MKTLIDRNIAMQYKEGPEEIEAAKSNDDNFHKSVSIKLIIYVLIMIAVFVSTITFT